MKNLLIFLIVLGFVSVCHAETVSVTSHSAVLLNQPGGKYSYSVLKVPQFYPFHVLEKNDHFLKVRDFEGRVGWIDKKDVAKANGIVVIADNVNIRKGPSTSFPVVFRAVKGVALKIEGEKDDWLKVIHESGQQGWIHKSLVWGY
jgi:SH3-like domain-containing protein